MGVGGGDPRVSENLFAIASSYDPRLCEDVWAQGTNDVSVAQVEDRLSDETKFRLMLSVRRADHALQLHNFGISTFAE